MSLWEEKFDTQCRIRRAVILHGNVYDIYWSNQPTGISFVQHIVELAKSKLNYKHIVCWDVNNGTQTFDKSSKEELNNDLKQSAQTQEANDNQDGGSEYDLGDDSATAQPEIDTSMKKPQDFFGFLLKRFKAKNTNATPTAYIVDGVDALFGNSNSLSEAERNLVLQIGQTLRDAPCSLNPGELKKNADLLILISSRLALIPPRFYQDNPAVADVNVNLPERIERADFIASHNTALKVRESMTKGNSDFEDFVDSLDHFTYRDIQQLCHLSISASKDDEPISYKKLVNLYKYGEKRSPWEELSREKLAGLDEKLKERVKGQDHVVERVTKVIKKAFVGLSGLQHSGRQQMPKGTFFFVGPTGVGKTEMAKSIAQFLFGDEEACIRFDMSEYSSEHSDQRLVGAPPGYVGYEEGGQLTNAVKQHPFSVLLFDEIEKAHSRIFDKFLQILEDGRLTDGKGDTVSFSEAIIIFTSNIGASEVKIDSKDPHADFIQKVKEHFVNDMKRPELLNRIGEANIIPFNYLTDTNVLMKIVAAKLKPLKEKLKEKYNLKLEIADQDNSLKILEDGFDRRNGGRGIANRLNEEIIEPLAEKLFESDDDELHGATMIGKLDKTGKHFWFHLDD